MNVNITVPSVGESITEGTIARWLRKEGDQVSQGEPLYELETDKATTEVPAPEAGVLHITVPEGNTVAVGTVIGMLDTDGKRNGKKKAAAPQADKKKESAPPSVSQEEKDQEQERGTETQISTTQEPAKEKEVARKEMPKPERVAVRDQPKPAARVDEREAKPSPAKEFQKVMTAHDPEDRREPMSPIRARIGQRLLASQKNTATLTTFNEADLSNLENLRARFQQRFQDKYGVKLGLMSFFVKACTAALQAHPIINAHIDNNDIIYHRHCNIGVAVSAEKGLFVPVLRAAERLTFAQIEKTIAELAKKARSGNINVQELQGGTFTITNGGVFGSLLSTPILNPPQSAILGLHTVQKRPVVVEEQIVIRPMMYLALSYDHRLIDGRDAVQFLVHVKQSIEKPESMLLEA